VEKEENHFMSDKSSAVQGNSPLPLAENLPFSS
jgi:hypothetical protein